MTVKTRQINVMPVEFKGSEPLVFYRGLVAFNLERVAVSRPQPDRQQDLRKALDEMGHGKESAMHGKMLERMVRELDLKPASNETVWESLALRFRPACSAGCLSCAGLDTRDHPTAGGCRPQLRSAHRRRCLDAPALRLTLL